MKNSTIKKLKKVNKKVEKFTPEFLSLWQHANNYIGESFTEYYTLLGQHRDSDILERSNFRCALDLLNGESKKVLVERSGHWAVGWVETILINKSAYKKLKIADKIKADLLDYPIVDDFDFSDLECEERSETFRDYKDDWTNELLEILKLNESKTAVEIKESLLDFAGYVYEADCSYRGQENGWFSTDKDYLERGIELVDDCSFESTKGIKLIKAYLKNAA